MSSSKAPLLRDATGACQRAVVANSLICLVIAGLLTGCSQRARIHTEVMTHQAALVPFDDLFVPEDSLVLDYSVILGLVWFMDVDALGKVLITDMASNLAHLFEGTGKHLAAYSMDTCLPIDGQHRLWSARFAENDRVILSTMGGDMVVVDQAGTCLAAKRMLLSTTLSFCSRGDSIYAYQGVQGLGPESTSMIGVFSMGLELVREIRLENPRLFRLNIDHTGLPGRNLDCFSDGPYYKYLEDMDARPVFTRLQVDMARPEFFVQRDEDIDQPSGAERNELDTPSELVGLFKLDEDIRMSLFRKVDEQYYPGGSAHSSVSGLSIASNSSQFKSVSTVPPTEPSTAGNGFLYFLGDHVRMANGDVGNPSVIRYRFIGLGSDDG